MPQSSIPLWLHDLSGMEMTNMRIVPYTVEDNESALSLESQCVQGESIVLRFRRPTFHMRSEVYDDYRILCAKVDEKLVGICAWAEKPTRYRSRIIRAAYIYDLRVHPAFRRQGVAQRLVRRISENIGQEVDCIYTLISGENERALGLAQQLFGTTLTMPFTYTIIPVYKRLKEKESFRLASATEIHDAYLRINHSTEFVPEFDEKKLLGHVASIATGKAVSGGCSIWTNENLLAEQVVAVSCYYQIQRLLTEPLRLFLNLPHIPKPTDTIRSWFLFDAFAREEEALRNLLETVNNIALRHDREFIYILLQDSDPTLAVIQQSGLRVYTVPYFFLAKGRVIPEQTEKVYIDIRDL